VDEPRHGARQRNLSPLNARAKWMDAKRPRAAYFLPLSREPDAVRRMQRVLARQIDRLNSLAGHRAGRLTTTAVVSVLGARITEAV